MALALVTIDDKFTLEKGRVFISGTQALVRAALMQHQRDTAAGLHTAGFISGYRGSPLGGLDLQLGRLKKLLAENEITFEPGLNEDLAATAVWGAQQANALPGATHDGVFGMWYGKGPGVDRSGDAIKHANNAGTSANGGVLAVFGDDHPGKSSTIAHQSEQAMVAFNIPVLYPSTVQEYIDFALLGWAMSRYCGLWIGFKCVNETVENTATVDVNPDRLNITLPPTDGNDINIKVRYAPQDDDVVLQRYRLPRVAAFAAANPVDRITHGEAGAGLGIVTSGKAWLDVSQALASIGIDDARARELGVAVYKVGLVWPLQDDGLRNFAKGSQELLFVEEKRAFIEPQAATALYHLPDAERPQIGGKTTPDGEPLLPSDIQLDALSVARAILNRLAALGRVDAALQARADATFADGDVAQSAQGAPLVRTPFFCSGCPHNRSTKIPEGSMAGSGIGCHGMATLFMSNTLAATQMGAEGANWIGMSRYTETPHLFQNLGDGTYSHSGLLAIRAAVNAEVNITYKILFNDAVAMTGGQQVEGQLTVDQVARQIAAEGVEHIAIITDEPNKYHRGYRFPDGAGVHDRAELDLIQRQMRDVSGVTAIIYDQTCAAEKRRRRKRGAFPNPSKRAFINESVCEGCGDCSVKANCVSIQPKDTPLGRKRLIDQSSCNKDFSCVEGFCPSFVTVNGAEPRKAVTHSANGPMTFDLPEPAAPALDSEFNILINGIGGTGVVTIGAVLGMASHMEGNSVSIYDMTGLSQKGGTVFSHLRLAPGKREIAGARIGAAQADLMLGCDLVVSASKESLSACRPGTAHAVVNVALIPTGAFQLNPDISLEVNPLQDRIRNTVGHNRTLTVDANGLARTLLGDTIGANMFMVGYALQSGLVPIGIAAIEQAIRLNGVAVDLNISALNLGRLAAHDPAASARLLDDASGTSEDSGAEVPTLDELIADRTRRLTDYQNSAYAARYTNLLAKLRTAEQALSGSPDTLTTAAARYLYKVMAYKDEYEVARLYTDGAFEKALAESFEPGYQLQFHLAPPWFAGRDPSSGLPAKRTFGDWILPAFRVLASLRTLRGGAFDVFGMSAERREERHIRDAYMTLLDRLARELTSENHAIAVELAEVPERIRGYGHVKQQHIHRANEARTALMEQFAVPPVPTSGKVVAERQVEMV
jgi:indolepyruvate ferredoxin oxidoreductase